MTHRLIRIATALATIVSLATPAALPVTAQATYYGACMVRSSGTSIPGYYAASLGTGYAKTSQSTVSSFEALQGLCTAPTYDGLMSSYCTTNSSDAQFEVVLYDTSGNYYGNTCSSLGCDYHPCSSSGGGSIPAAPSNLRLGSAATQSSAYLLWNDNSTNEDKFNVERKLSSDSAWSGTFLIQTGASVTSHTDATVSAGATYDYRVQACLSGYGCSSYVYLNGVAIPSGGDTSLIGHWKFDGNGNNEISGSPAAQSVGGATYQPSGGHAGGYAYIPTGNDYFSIPHQSSFDLPNTFTVEFWFRQRADRNHLQDLVSKGTPTNNYSFRIFRQLWNEYNYGPIITGYTADSSGYWTQTSNANQLSHSQWHHVAFVKDATRRAYYLDGVEIHSATDSPAARLSTSPIKVGGSAVDTDIDDLRIYNRALSASEVQQAVGGSSSPTPTPAPAGTIPFAPSNLAVSMSGQNIGLTWTDNATNESQMKVYRKLADQTTRTLIASLTANTTSYTDVQVPAGYYYYDVDACNDYGCSTSNWMGASIQSGFWIDSMRSYPYPGEQGVSATPKILVYFNQDVDASTLTAATIFLAQNTNLDAKVSGSITPLRDGVEFSPATQLLPGTTYRLTLKGTIRSASGHMLGYDDYRTFTTSASTESGSAVLSGTVSNATGGALAGAYITLRSSNYAVSKYTQSQNDGTYRIENIPTGTYALELYSPYSSTGLISPPAIEVSFAAGDMKTKNLSFVAASKTIRGTVTRKDGSAVTDAQVGAYQEGSASWNEARTDASGSYSLRVRGGEWKVGIKPFSASADWSYFSAFPIVSFMNDNAPEEKNVNFSVTSARAGIRGKVVRGDGLGIESGTIWIGAYDAFGNGNGAAVNADGTFSVTLSAGIYTLHVSSKDPLLSAPPLPPVALSEGQVTDIGTITLTTSNETISGKVTDENGAGVVNAVVVVGSRDTNQYLQTRSDAAGRYSIAAKPGTWYARVMPDPALPYSYFGEPREISIAAGQAAIADFRLTKADTLITGSIQNESGIAVTDLFGFVSARPETAVPSGMGSGGEFGSQVERGIYSIRVPAGTYTLTLHLAPGSAYAPGLAKTVTVSAGKTATVNLSLASATARITGTLIDEHGAVLIGIPVKVFASGEGAWRDGSVNTASGAYRLDVSAGAWSVGARISPETGYVLAESEGHVMLAPGGSATHNFVARKAGAVLTGKVTKPSGEGASGAYVKVTKNSFGGSFDAPDALTTGTQTDENGTYRIQLPEGFYYVNVFAPASPTLLNPEEKSAALAAGETVTLNLSFRPSDTPISGTVLLDDAGTEAFVWAWSEKGGFVEGRSDKGGLYRLNVRGSETWRVAASAELEGRPYRSSEAAVAVGTSPAQQNLILSPLEFKLPNAEVRTVAATAVSKITASNGAGVTLAPSAVSTGGEVVVSVIPTSETPSQGATKVVGLGYEIEARDQSGAAVTKLNTNATVEIPYYDEDLARYNISASDLAAAFWDETSAAWKKIEHSVVNTATKIVTAQVDHFTRFAIIAAADITAPQAPAQASALLSGPGRVTLSWTNPVSDFHHIKIYRSAVSGELGTGIFDGLAATTQTDTGLTDGTTYYYTVRAVDPAGNESSNRTQISILVSGTSVKEPKPASSPAGTVTFTRDLSLGSEGADVKALQLILNAEGAPIAATGPGSPGNESTYFGALTKAAVIRFQEKYRAEILAPAGLSAGTGRVGPSTRGKLNALARVTANLEKTGASGLVVATANLTRNLALGAQGDDVKTLQGILVTEGVYPEAIASGYFGALTKAAVIRFQEKYRAEILVPAGLSAGTGYVGAGTRAKLNALIK